MTLEFKAVVGVLRGPMGFRLGPIRRWIHNWLVSKGKPEGYFTFTVKVDGQKATLRVKGEATKGVPKPDLTLQIMDNGELLASRTWSRVELGQEFTVTATVTELNSHYALGRMVLSNVIGTDTYEESLSYEIKPPPPTAPPPPPKPLTVKISGYTSTPDGWVALSGSVTGGKPPYDITIDWGDGTVDRNPDTWMHQYKASGTYRVTVTAVDSAGAKDSDSITVKVTVEAPPEVVTYTLTIIAGDGGTTDPAPGDYQYDKCTNVTVKAKPDPDWFFAYWLLDGETRTENPITVHMDSDHVLAAYFNPVGAVSLPVVETLKKFRRRIFTMRKRRWF